jgi:K+/H+ antiporter YhaU regulatory subunit KhtT
MMFNPSADTTIGAGENVIAVGSIKDLKKLETILNP